MDIVAVAKTLAKEHEGTLIYLTKFGSHLYGTDGPDSDVDYKGIFLPSKESCILGKPPKSLQFSTGNPGAKNQKGDIDLQLWSLQYFMELVSKGETNALDLLYSYTHDECIEYTIPKNDVIFFNTSRLFSVKDCKAYTGYAIGQAKKYGIKGSRLGVIKQIYEWLQDKACEDGTFDMAGRRLYEYAPEISEKFHHPSYCFNKTVDGANALVLCGKVHLFNITMGEFSGRITRDYEKYGERAKAAERNEGVDWKALSHALRALQQMQQLITKGRIQYPLEGAKLLKAVKGGTMTFSQVEALIQLGLSIVADELDNLTTPLCVRDDALIRKIILSSYQ